MKVWTAKEGESLRLKLADGQEIEVKLIRTKGRKAVVGIDAPHEVKILIARRVREAKTPALQPKAKGVSHAEGPCGKEGAA